MPLPIKILSTDFDGTLHSDCSTPPVPRELEEALADFQGEGGSWVINTGRDLPSLLEGLVRCRLEVRPDFVVVVEREIYRLEGADYVSVADWNERCDRQHSALFEKVAADLPRLVGWIAKRYQAQIYEDSYSPFCLIAESPGDAAEIHDFLAVYCEQVGDLTVMRNDIYARLSHVAYNKGTALGEIARRLSVRVKEVAAAGDHLNDLPMLRAEYAAWLMAPANAVPEVQKAVRDQGGFVSAFECGKGVLDGLEWVRARNQNLRCSAAG